MKSKNLGIILCVLGGTAGIWVFTRLTSLAGKLHSWEPPFTEYETTTIVGGIIAIIFIIVGLINLTKKKDQHVNYVEQDAKIEKVVKNIETEKTEEDERKKEAEKKRKEESLNEYYKKKDNDFLKY